MNQYLNLEERTTKFSRNILAFCRNEKLTVIKRPIIDQLIRSATSIGANYSEANNAASKLDFRNKIFIAKKETAETKYWLTLLADFADDQAACKELARECQYILMTFQKIISSLNHGKRVTVNGEGTVNGKW